MDKSHSKVGTYTPATLEARGAIWPALAHAERNYKRRLGRWTPFGISGLLGPRAFIRPYLFSSSEDALRFAPHLRCGIVT